MAYIIATNRKWYKYLSEKLSSKLKEEFILIDKKEDLTFERLQEIRPKYVFFPHWSYIIPSRVYENYECIIFHMTDVPFGRGGSPLQNLVSRGIYETKITALKCQADIDAGPVYIKKPFSLYGTAEEIYIRASKLIEEMICYITKNKPNPIEQCGQEVYFDRRTPEDSNINKVNNLEQLYDYIRMLDADGYPKAFLETENFRFEFERASLKNGYLISDVKITKKEQKHE